MSVSVPTQRDIAREAGVSQAVVSAVVNGRTERIGASEDVKRRVKAVAERLGYRLHTGARAMRSQRSGTIGYFAPGRFKWDFDFPGTRPGLFDEAEENGFRVVYARFGSGIEIPRVLRELSLDGLIVHHGGALEPEFAAHLRRHKIPVVFLNDRRARNAVYLDDARAAAEMTRHLIKRGYRRITYFSSMPFIAGHHSWVDRVAGYTATLTSAGLHPSTLLLDGLKREASRGALLDYLSSAEPPDAFFCHTDHDAAVMLAWLYGSSWEVPRDFALAGFEMDPICVHYFPFSLTTMQVKRYEMARAAVGMLVRLMEPGAPRRLPSVVFHPELSEGLSTPQKPHSMKQ